jgi:prepilin-type N-terminal cleavage/methylation domain-containing protein
MNLKAAAKRRLGFTLVELLLGLAITAIIGASVYNMFWTSMKLDDKMRRVHDNYMEVLMADQALTYDLENAINLDLSGSYPDAVIFDGHPQEFSFLTQTAQGIKRVRYYSGLLDEGNVTKSMIGRVVNPSNSIKNYSAGSLPIEFLVRQESSLADWLNETNTDTSTQIVAAGLKKGSFNCQYAPFVKDLHTSGSQGVDYKETWNDKGLPLAVSCSFVLYDPKNPLDGLMFKHDIFLAPVPSYHNEQ